MTDALLKPYRGLVPPCGVYCGGCPVYIRQRKPCPGAEKSRRCESKNCRFYLCTRAKKVDFCHQCPEYPCKSFKAFARSWTKYGQDFLANQRLLKDAGDAAFLDCWNAKASRVAAEGEL